MSGNEPDPVHFKSKKKYLFKEPLLPVMPEQMKGIQGKYG
jgi:hypothetical protein